MNVFILKIEVIEVNYLDTNEKYISEEDELIFSVPTKKT